MADPDPAAEPPGETPAEGKTPLSRRTALGALGLGVIGGAAAGSGMALWLGRDNVAAGTDGSSRTGTATQSSTSSQPVSSTTPHPTSTAPTEPGSGIPAAASQFTRKDWLASRGKFYYIAHRGSGDVYPENSIQAFRAAVGAGARCMEISVGMTSDGRLICMHDLTYDRTTTATGKVADQPSTILRSVSLKSPQLGPAWNEPPLPRVPFLEDVLDVVGGRAVLCLEAKVDTAYPSMMALAESLGLKDSVVVKAYHTSSRISQAKSAGYPVFGYLGNPDDVTSENISGLAGRLDSATDCLVVPAYDGSRANGYLADDAVRACVATGIPVWVFPVHRRADAAHFRPLGIQGIITSSFAYVSGSTPIANADTWRYRAIAPGEMTKDPASPGWAPAWANPDQIELGLQSAQHFLTLGQFAPIAAAAGTYRIDFDAEFTTLPGSPDGNLTIAFGRTDDGYYENGVGRGTGYHAVMSAQGRLQLFRHTDENPDGVPLGSSLDTDAPGAGQWMQFRVDVSPTQVAWSRLDGGSQKTIAATDTTVRGGYLHIGRGGTDGAASFRRLVITPSNG